MLQHGLQLRRERVALADEELLLAIGCSLFEPSDSAEAPQELVLVLLLSFGLLRQWA